MAELTINGYFQQLCQSLPEAMFHGEIPQCHRNHHVFHGEILILSRWFAKVTSSNTTVGSVCTGAEDVQCKDLHITYTYIYMYIYIYRERERDLQGIIGISGNHFKGFIGIHRDIMWIYRFIWVNHNDLTVLPRWKGWFLQGVQPL